MTLCIHESVTALGNSMHAVVLISIGLILLSHKSSYLLPQAAQSCDKMGTLLTAQL